MSTPVTNQQPSAPQNNVVVPTFLEKAGKTTKIIAAIVAAILGIGSFGIGITMTPFSPEFGAAAIATGTALFGLAGYLIYSGVSSQRTSQRTSSPVPDL